MQPLTVIENFDVFEYRRPGFITGFEIAMMNQFGLESVEKTFSNGVVLTVSFFAHAGDHAVCRKSFPVTIGCVLAAPIAMKNKPFVWFPFPEGRKYLFLKATGL